MAINKDKVRAAAQKYLQKGQIDKAIREYGRLVEEDPRDVRTLLKIGDLHTRRGDRAEATATYTQVASFYSEQGFFLKAVAVYKQILKLDPELIEVNQRLAELYHQLGLTSDATNQYRQISHLYEKEGRIQDSLRVLQRMIELDPDNVAGRIKLGEMYAEQGMIEEARHEFHRAATYLRTQQRIDDYIKVAERILRFEPGDLNTSRELASTYIQRGDARRALAKLQTCFRADPKDVDTLNLLAEAFKDLGQTDKTISVYRELVRIHTSAGRHDSARKIAERILNISPEDTDASRLLGGNFDSVAPPREASAAAGDLRIQPNQRGIRPPDSVTEVGPPGPQAAGFGATVAAEQEGGVHSEAVAKLLVETDIYIKYGLKAKAIEHLNKVFSVDPGHREARQKLLDLLLEGGNKGAAANTLFTMATYAQQAGDLVQARQDAQLALQTDAQHSNAAKLLESLDATDPATEDLHADDDDDFEVDLEGMTGEDSTGDGAGAAEFEPEVEVEVEPEIEVGVEPEVELEIEPEIEPEVETEVELEVEPEVEVEVEPEVEVEIQSEVEVEVESEIELEPADGLEFEVEADVAAESHLDVDVVPTLEIEIEPEPEPEPDVEVEAEMQAEFGSAVEFEPPVEPEPAVEFEPAVESESAVEFEPAVEPEPAVELESAVEFESDYEPEPVLEVESAVLPDFGLEPESESALEIDSVLEPEPEPELEFAPEVESPSAAELEAESTLEVDPQFEFESALEVEPRLESESESALEVGPGSTIAPDPGSLAPPDFAGGVTPGSDIPAEADSEVLLEPADDVSDPTELYRAGEAAAELAVEAEPELDYVAQPDLGAGREGGADGYSPEFKVVAEDDGTVAGESLSGSGAEPWAEGLAAPESVSGDGPSDTALDIEDELEEIDFLLAQGLGQEAQEVFEGLEARLPQDPRVMALASRFTTTGASPPTTEETEPAADELVDGVEPSDAANPIEEIVAGDFDFAAELAAELKEVAEAEDVVQATEFQFSAEDIFEQFKRGVADQVEDSDHDTHYDLGIAYREMGLLDDALREFQLVKSSPDRRVAALTMIGTCCLDLDKPDEALVAFHEALAAGDLGESEDIAVRFDIGVTLERLNRHGEASEFFGHVHVVDPAFRDVSDRLVRNRAMAEDSPEESLDSLLDDPDITDTSTDAPKARKISYI